VTGIGSLHLKNRHLRWWFCRLSRRSMSHRCSWTAWRETWKRFRPLIRL